MQHGLVKRKQKLTNYEQTVDGLNIIAIEGTLRGELQNAFGAILLGSASLFSKLALQGINRIQMPFFHSRNHSSHRPLAKLEHSHSRSHSPGPKEEAAEGNEGRWDDSENLRFAVFLAYHQDVFSSRHQRKHSRIFKTLASHLADRTAPQCRSHFQKLLVKHRTAAKIKKHFRLAFGEEVFDRECEIFREEWESSRGIVRRTVAFRELREAGTQTEEAAAKKEAENQLLPHLAEMAKVERVKAEAEQPPIYFPY